MRNLIAMWYSGITSITPVALLVSGGMCTASAQRPLPVVPFRSGMTITSSARIAPGTYVAPAGDSAALTVRGNGITVDMRGVILVGDTNRARPDRFAGVAVRIDGGSHVTVQGAHLRGYKIGIVARGVRGLRLLDNDLSYNWKPRLYSGVEKESLIDWLDYHQNDKDEWLRYGAGIYLSDVHGGELRGNTVRQGMNGLLLTRTDSVKIWNNDFSFNSGVGLGMYRASYNVVMHNRIDWNVRGYSHGFYNRGQDSAGLLIYEQSCHNVVAYNSVTHGGDGLFLWAGQHTMDTGDGGANDNLFYRNDFSHAPTNGMEATFSRNAFVENRVEENWHGLWGGYSFGSVILGNRFARNVEAIAIEHGQDNRIVGNTFDADSTAIHLWWNKLEPSDWGYPKYRDTRSRDYTILGNAFSPARLALRIDNTQRVRVDGNAMRTDSVLRATGDTSGWYFRNASVAAAVQVPRELRVAPLAGGMSAMIPAGRRRGRNTIIVDEWGPYDWQSPKLWPTGRSDATPQRLRVLGPPGRWKVSGKVGVAQLSAIRGSVGDTLVVTPAPGHETDWKVTLKYIGAATLSPFGARIAAGRPVTFSYQRFEPVANWHVIFVPWDSIIVRRSDAAAITRALTAAPIATMDTSRLDLTWYGPPRKTIPQARLLTGATTTMQLARGDYVLQTIADDAIRVYIDDTLVLDDWVAGESHVKEVPFHATGQHRFRVEHLQVEGWYELTVRVLRRET